MTDPRVALVDEHMRLENAHDFDGCIAKFGRARYEVLASGETYDGASGVDRFLRENRRAFPDFRFEPTRVSPGPDAVVVEGRFTGTHEGMWRGLPGTGRRVDFPMCLVFEFEGDTMVNERIYFDLGTPLRQLGVAVDPNSPRGKLQAFPRQPRHPGEGHRPQRPPPGPGTRHGLSGAERGGFVRTRGGKGQRGPSAYRLRGVR